MTFFTIKDAASLLAIMTLAVPASLLAQEVATPPPLHERIDQIVAKGNVAAVAAPAGDAELVRRIYLDLAGRIPTSAEARAYLQDSDTHKRAKLVDRLVASREFARHIATTFDIWLMERREEKHVPGKLWREYLTDSFAANKPYDQLVREILSADGSEENNRAPARFYLDRKGEPHVITRDVGRLFLGKDLQCAQCHDHPNIADYLQRDYYGLFAFFNRSALFQPDTNKPALLSEKATGEASYQSVFTDVKGATRPRLLGGDEIDEPAIKAGEEWKVKPHPKDKKVRPIPVFSRRALLGPLVSAGTDRAFNHNIANRLWAQMMGRGLVEPSDFAHSGNPAAHPELLDMLADEFVAMKFDVRAFLRALALTETYARSFEMPAALADQADAVAANLASMESQAQQLAAAARAAKTAFEEAKETWEEAQKAIDAQAGQLAAAIKKRDEAAAAKNKVEEPLEKARALLAAGEAKLQPLAEADTKTAEAVKSLPDDKELADAAAKFKQRADQLRAEVKKLQVEVAEKQKPADAAGAQLAEATAAADQLQKLVDGEQAKVAALRAELDRAHARSKTETSGAEYAKRRFDDARDLVAYAATRRESRATSEAASRLGSELAGFENDTAAKQELAADLDEAARRSASAKAALADDAELAKAAELLRDRSEGARARAEAASAELAGRKAEADAASASAAELQTKLDAATASLTTRWTNAFAIGVFTPLTPEQLCASTLRATGEWDRNLAAAEAEFKTKLEEAAKKPAEPENKDENKDEKKDEKKAAPPPPLTEADHGRFVEDQVDTKLKAAFDKFIKLFGGQPGQPQSDFYATADQALFFENDGLVRGWLRPNGENLTGRLVKMDDAAQLAEELYLSTVTRLPSDEEIAQVRNYLAAREKERANAIQELAWALISSVEFRFKH